MPKHAIQPYPMGQSSIIKAVRRSDGDYGFVLKDTKTHRVAAVGFTLDELRQTTDGLAVLEHFGILPKNEPLVRAETQYAGPVVPMMRMLTEHEVLSHDETQD